MKSNRVFGGMSTIIMMALLVVSMTAPSLVRADLRETARQTLKEKSKAIVTLEVVTETKISYGGGQDEQEEKSEVLGVVVGSDGLVVAALSSIDQSQLWDRMQAGREDMGYTIRVKSLKYILSDNSEVPATIVLRDNDLDLAFLRPLEEPESPMTFIDLENNDTAQILDPVFCLARMGRIARRTHVGMTGEIQGVVTRPREYYIPSSELTSGGLGTPIFNDEGKILGLILLHVLPGGSAVANSSDERVIPVVIPARDIQEVAVQAPKQASPEPEEASSSDSMEEGPHSDELSAEETEESTE